MVGVNHHQRQPRTNTPTTHDDDERIRPPRGRRLAPALTARRAGWAGSSGDARRGPSQPDATRRVLEDIRRSVTHVELAELPFVANTHDDQVDFAFERLIHDRRANVTGLQDLSFKLDAKFIGDVLGATE